MSAAASIQTSTAFNQSTGAHRRQRIANQLAARTSIAGLYGQVRRIAA